MNAIAKALVCVLIRGDVEFWMEAERAEVLKKALETGQRFVVIDGSTVNTFEIIGIFPASVMEERTRRKNGQWNCRLGAWHDRKEVCECQAVSGQVQYRVPVAGVEFVAGKRVQDRETQDAC